MSIISASATSDTNGIVSSLNTLLTELHIPITLETPTDLIPSLLIAILESILKSRLPISPDVRESRNQPAKVQAMKIFLGVFENDVLGMDVGLSEVDPRRLALGDWDEVVFVGELLCWLGKKRGILPPETVETLRDVEDSSIIPKFRNILPDRTQSPSTRSTVTNSAVTEFSIHSTNTNTTSDTTVMTGSLPSEDLESAPIATSSRLHPLPRQPRCIHEIEDASLMVPDGDTGDRSIGLYSQTESYCNCSNEDSPSQQPNGSVRYTGWIDTVNDSLELESFERGKHSGGSEYPSRSTQLDTGPLNSGLTGAKRVVTKHSSPSQHKLALLNERAKLLSELAKLKASSRST